MQLMSKHNKVFIFLICITDFDSKHPWVVPLKHKKSIAIANSFQKLLHGSNCKPNKIWVDKGSEFCNRSIK